MKRRYLPFSQVPIAATLDRNLGHADYRLLAIIAGYINNRTGWAFPSLALLADKMGYGAKSGPRIVRRSLQALANAGHLRRRAGSGRVSSRYQVVYDRPEPPKDDTGEDDFDDDGGDEFPGSAVGNEGGEARGGYFGQGDQGGPGREVQGGPGERCKAVPRNYTKEPDQYNQTNLYVHSLSESASEERSVPQQPPQASAREGGVRTGGSGVQAKGPGAPEKGIAAIITRHQGDFGDWYRLYPRKRSRADALKAYAQAIQKGARPAEMYAGLARQLPAMLKADPQYLPFPATWLRGARWEDLPDPAPKPPMTGGLV